MPAIRNSELDGDWHFVATGTRVEVSHGHATFRYPGRDYLVDRNRLYVDGVLIGHMDDFDTWPDTLRPVHRMGCCERIVVCQYDMGYCERLAACFALFFLAYICLKLLAVLAS